MSVLQFVHHGHEMMNVYIGHHVPGLVALSLGMAMLASFVSLLHINLIRQVKFAWQRYSWHASGALAMGLGVWSMHFIGMVSFRIDVPIYYSPWLTAISVLPAILAAWVTLRVLYRSEDSWRSILIGGLMMGAGIGAMHYTGMAAIRTQATMVYLPGMVIISVVVAVVMAVLALATRKLLIPFIRNINARLVVCALVMGLAVSSMHYTAMHAAVFLPNPLAGDVEIDGADANLLIVSTVLVAIFIVLMSAVVVLYARRQKTLEISAEVQREKLKEVTQRLHLVAQRVPGMVYQLHRETSGYMSFKYLSEGVNHLFKISVDEALGDAKRLLTKVPQQNRQAILESLSISANNLSAWNYEFPVQSDGEAMRWLAATSTPQQEDDGSVSWNGFLSDITQKKKNEETIHKLAYYDSLTQLPNRRYLLKNINSRLAEQANEGQTILVIAINMDGFKRVNDVHGQQQGDLLLNACALRIGEGLSSKWLLTRFSADEFFLAGSFKTAEQAKVAAEGVCEYALKALAEPFELPQLRYQGSASAGIVMVQNEDVGAEELLRRADLAAHKAKEGGGNTWLFYHDCIEHQISERFRLETELRAAINSDELVLFYQLQANSEGQFYGAEALLRWQHPQRGMVSPAEFIPLAEETGLIVPIGELVIRQACEQLARWQKTPATAHLTLSVNVSAKQFYQHNFVELVLEEASAAGAPFNQLKLELTESLVLEDMQGVVQKMEMLKRAGIRFSMDDFGTGYSSLSYLSQLPFDEVKIDQAFTRRALEDAYERDWTIVRAIINIATDLGMEVIAEGVETEAQQERLFLSGCYRYQGYLFSRPSPANDLPLQLISA